MNIFPVFATLLRISEQLMLRRIGHEDGLFCFGLGVKMQDATKSQARLQAMQTSKVWVGWSSCIYLYPTVPTQYLLVPTKHVQPACLRQTFTFSV